MTAVAAAPLYGLILTGGQSSRMNQDKAALQYGGVSALDRAMSLLSSLAVYDAYVSIRPDQQRDLARNRYPVVVDLHSGIGPIAGIAAAQAAIPHVAWLVLACDLPLLDPTTLGHLIRARDARRPATAYRSAFDGLPEPLCAIYEPDSAAGIRSCIDSKAHCPRKFLLQSGAALIELQQSDALSNVNTPAEYSVAMVNPRLRPRAPDPAADDKR